MKKLLSIAFVITSMTFVASSANAQGRNNQRNIKANQTYNQNYKQVVRTYTQTKKVWIRNKQYIETYKVDVFRNGKTNSTLISRVELNKRHGNDKYQAAKISYKTSTIWENGRKYKVTYKITKLNNGRTNSQIVSKVRV